MRQDRQRIELYMGTTGSGKTTLMLEHLREERQVFLFDFMNDEKFEDYGVLCESMEDAIHLAGKCRAEGKPFRIRLQLADPERFDFLCKCLVKRPHGLEVFRNTTLAVDELALVCSHAWMPESLSNLVRLGRHTDSRLVATTQRPPDIHPFIRSQAKAIYLFQMHEPADLDVFRKRLESPERLISLNVGEYILWHPQRMKKSLSVE